MSNANVHIFSNGTEFSCWTSANCDRCVKEPTCDLLHGGIADAFLGHGLFTQKTADRMGYRPELSAKLGWPCLEFLDVPPGPKPAAQEMRECGALMLPGLEPAP